MQSVRRPLFVATILTGSFLLFLIQPLVARMALPRLGGAPNVWNSAMLVYQALLLGGYFYAHRLGRLAIKRQAQIHLGLLALAALTLPVGLVNLPSPRQGLEAIWVPLLIALSVGPVFLLVSAQAPLMQRWFAAREGAGAPWALYAASNLGSFTGLLAYPLLAEPLLTVWAQSWLWSIGYGLLLVLIALCAKARWSESGAAETVASAKTAPIGPRRIALWLALAAVPSGLMLSTTTHLTTDLFAMPLLWVIPLGLYLLSFVFAFAELRTAARFFTLLAWPLLFTAGTIAMVSQGSSGLTPVIASVVLLFVACVALHARLYDERPEPDQLTLFYLVMSAGGVLGGLFTALIAPLTFDWAWEHPLLVLAAAALVPRSAWLDWRRLPGLDRENHRLVVGAALAIALLCTFQIYSIIGTGEGREAALPWLLGVLFGGMVISQWRSLALPLLAFAMLAEGGMLTVKESLAGMRQRSYFGIYTVREATADRMRTLAHGTTLHGQQSTEPQRRLDPLSYYGPSSGAGIAFGHAQAMFGVRARLGVVGLGAGSLACYHRPGEDWRFFEIDPLVLSYSQKRTFTFLKDCAPDAQVILGDARLELGKVRAGSFDMLAIDAFSSDAIPLHLLTDEALGVYERALRQGGLLLIHISNRFIDLEPVLDADARHRGLIALKREDNPDMTRGYTASTWVALSRDPATLDRVKAQLPTEAWEPLAKGTARVWTDDYASILPHVQWSHILGPKK